MKGKWIKWIFKRIKGAYKHLVLLVFSSVLLSIVNILFALILKGFIDSAVSGTAEKVFRLIVYAVIVVLLEGFSYVLSSYSKKNIQARTEYNLRSEMFSAVIRADYADTEKYSSGELINMFSNDINAVSTCIPEITYNIAGQLLQAVSAGVVLFIISWKIHCVAKNPAIPEKKWVPSYVFEIRKEGCRVGEINFRVGYSDSLYYGGQIGYAVDEQHRGHGYAEKACSLLVPVIRAHGMKKVLITNEHTNIASRRTCEKLGAELIRKARLPEWHDLYKEGQRYVNIFEWSV